jgi:putative transposase
MPFTKVMIHFIWSTKNRMPTITHQLKPLLLQHIIDNAKEKGIYIDCVNCVKDHIHLLVSLSTDQTIAKTVMLIKGESAYWVNKQNILTDKFEWQEEYMAFSVSKSGIDNVRLYIANQEEHHKSKTFKEEYDAFLNAHGLG